jgi:hypothetical protein
VSPKWGTGWSWHSYPPGSSLVPLPDVPSIGHLSAQQVDQTWHLQPYLKINYHPPPRIPIHKMIIHQTLIGEMIPTAVLLPNVPPPACWACWAQPVASWPSGFTDSDWEAECWSLRLALSRHSSGCPAKASLPLGPLSTVLLWVWRLLCKWLLLAPGSSWASVVKCWAHSDATA